MCLHFCFVFMNFTCVSMRDIYMCINLNFVNFNM